MVSVIHKPVFIAVDGTHHDTMEDAETHEALLYLSNYLTNRFPTIFHSFDDPKPHRVTANYLMKDVTELFTMKERPERKHR